MGFEQRNDEWYDRRVGKITASCISDVMAKGKGSSPSLTREKYKCQLAAERMTWIPCGNTFISKAMQDGMEKEPLAKIAYELATGNLIEDIDFVDYPDIKVRAGASPDGRVGEDGLVEIKCPELHTHIGYLLSREIPANYQYQMAFQLICESRAWCDWVSYNDQVPEEMQTLVIRFKPTAEFLTSIITEVIKFDKEVDELVAKLRDQYKKE